MTAANNIVAYQPPQSPAVWRGVIPTGMDDSLRMAKVIVASGVAPRSLFADGVDPTAAVWTVLQLGAEVGLSPMASVQNVCLINGRPGLFGPAMLAVVEASGKLAAIEEGIEGKDDARHAYCRVTRVGRSPRTSTFSVGDAKRAGLWDKRGRNGAPGPWQQYPDRMLQARARSFALRDVFPDVLLGLSYSAEELQDIPPEAALRDSTPPAAEPAAPVAPKKSPLLINLPHGWEPVQFERTRKGLVDALRFLADAVIDRAPEVVGLNNDLLDLIAEKMPEMAGEVSELRAAAAEAMAGTVPGALDPDEVDAFGLPPLHQEPEVLPTDPP